VSPAAPGLLHDAGALERLVAQLVAIDSVNPDLVPGGAGEARIAAFVAGWLRDAGLDVEIDEPAPGRPSVLAIARGRGGGRALVLCAHTDTVGVEGMADPHTPRVSDGRLHGRGAYDMKGGLAACMAAGAAAARAGLAGDVVVAAVSDEEYASVGARSVAARIRADAAIVTEPTALGACVAHKGFAWARIEARGRAAHGSRPDLGADAIVHMGAVLAELRELDRRLEAARHPLVGRGSVHASVISGGQELSSYPERCTLEIERRTLPGDTAAALQDELADVLARAQAREPALDATATLGLVREPFEVEPDAEVVAAVRRVGGRVVRREIEVVGHTAWMDAAILAAAGIPTVVFGPGGAGAHAVEEWVDLREVALCAEVLLRVAAELCG
jgi:acetylornithine deacetylase